MKKFLERSFHRQPVIAVKHAVEPVSITVEPPQERNISVVATDFSGPVFATVSFFPEAINTVTTLVVPRPTSHARSLSLSSLKSAKKSLLDEIREVDSIPSRLSSKLKKRRKSDAKMATQSFSQDNDYMGRLLTKSLNAQEDLKSLKLTLAEIEKNQTYLSSKVSQLRHRIDCLYQLTTRIERSIENTEKETEDMRKRQKVLTEECFELLLQVQSSRWSVYALEALGPDQSM